MTKANKVIQVWHVVHPVEVECSPDVDPGLVGLYLRTGVAVQMPRMSLDIDAPDIHVVSTGAPVVVPESEARGIRELLGEYLERTRTVVGENNAMAAAGIPVRELHPLSKSGMGMYMEGCRLLGIRAVTPGAWWDELDKL